VIEAVLFDGDQTLWDFERVMREALSAVAGELRAARPGAFTDALSWEDLERDRAVVGEQWEGVEYNLARLRVLGFARTLERLRDAEGGDDAADEALTLELNDSYFVHGDRDPSLFPDTVSCLEVLRPRYRLGLLSNGSRLPEKVGLAQYFESVVFAQDHRVAKPEKGIFEIAERELGVAPGCRRRATLHLVGRGRGDRSRAVRLEQLSKRAAVSLRLHLPDRRGRGRRPGT
jgi:putative hydrolase of the HAD superfamily